MRPQQLVEARACVDQDCIICPEFTEPPHQFTRLVQERAWRSALGIWIFDVRTSKFRDYVCRMCRATLYRARGPHLFAREMPRRRWHLSSHRGNHRRSPVVRSRRTNRASRIAEFCPRQEVQAQVDRAPERRWVRQAGQSQSRSFKVEVDGKDGLTSAGKVGGSHRQKQWCALRHPC